MLTLEQALDQILYIAKENKLRGIIMLSNQHEAKVFVTKDINSEEVDVVIHACSVVLAEQIKEAEKEEEQARKN